MLLMRCWEYIYIYIYVHFLWVHSNLGVLPSEPQVFRIAVIFLHCSGMVVWWVEAPRILGSCCVNGDLGAFF